MSLSYAQHLQYSNVSVTSSAFWLPLAFPCHLMWLVLSLSVMSEMHDSYTDLPTCHRWHTSETCCFSRRGSCVCQAIINFVCQASSLLTFLVPRPARSSGLVYSSAVSRFSFLHQPQAGTVGACFQGMVHACRCCLTTSLSLSSTRCLAPNGLLLFFQLTRWSAALTCLTLWKWFFKGWDSP